MDLRLHVLFLLVPLSTPLPLSLTRNSFPGARVPLRSREVRFRRVSTALGVGESGRVGSAPMAVVVGGGPAGLTSAIVLAERGWDVTVLEQRSAPSVYDASKAYLYLVDTRGQRILDRYNITSTLASKGVSGLEFTLTRVFANGEMKTSVPPSLDPSRKPTYWIPREELLEILNDEAMKRDNIHVLYSTKVNDIQQDEGVSIVSTQGPSGNPDIRADLLVGADGINSAVREVCGVWSDDKKGFTPRKHVSPSTGLRYKMIKLPPAFPISKNKTILSESRKAYAIVSSIRSRRRKARLGLLPVANPNRFRTANIIQPKGHDVWKMKEGKEVTAWLEKAFPQLSIKDIITPQEADNFAKEKGGEFPAPQYSPRLQCTSPKGAKAVLIGDSIHAFPPDIGQGVNAALEDVAVLEDVINDEMGPSASNWTPNSIQKVIQKYETERAPDAKALARIAQIGYPYQYSQSMWRSKLWFVNFVLRTFILSKILPSIFDPSAIVMVQKSELRYSEIWSRAQRTTRRILFTISALAIAIACRSFSFDLPLAGSISQQLHNLNFGRLSW